VSVTAHAGAAQTSSRTKAKNAADAAFFERAFTSNLAQQSMAFP